MVANNFNIYLLEINNKPGFGKYGEDIGWDAFNKSVSHNLFSFILDNVVFPFFGIKETIFQDISATSITHNGHLSQFIDILSKYILIPYLGKLINNLKNDQTWIKLINLSDQVNIFLIKRVANSGNIIGYIGLTRDHYLILKMQSTQSTQSNTQQIITVMVAQFLEIMIARHYIHKSKGSKKIIKIAKTDMHIHSTAKILHFKLNNNNYEKYL